MWTFLTHKIAKRRLRAAFGRFFLYEDTLRDILEMSNGRLEPLPPPEREDISYVALQVRGDTPEQLQCHLAQAIDVVVNHGGMV